MEYKIDQMLDKTLESLEVICQTSTGFRISKFIEINYQKVDMILTKAKETRQPGYAMLASLIKEEFNVVVSIQVLRSTFYRIKKRKNLERIRAETVG